VCTGNSHCSLPSNARFSLIIVIHPQVELLYAPPGTDLVLAATRDRSLVAWQHNPTAAHRCVGDDHVKPRGHGASGFRGTLCACADAPLYTINLNPESITLQNDLCLTTSLASLGTYLLARQPALQLARPKRAATRARLLFCIRSHVQGLQGPRRLGGGPRGLKHGPRSH
jgi:hypothetical protein